MTKGLDEILANLTKLQAKAPKVARAAVSEVADEFEKQLKVNTPEYFIVDDVHARDDTVVTGFKGANEGIVSKDIGFGRKTGWRIHFPDTGTSHQKAQNFKEKTITEMTPKAKEIYAQKVKEGLGL